VRKCWGFGPVVSENKYKNKREIHWRDDANSKRDGEDVSRLEIKKRIKSKNKTWLITAIEPEKDHYWNQRLLLPHLHPLLWNVLPSSLFFLLFALCFGFKEILETKEEDPVFSPAVISFLVLFNLRWDADDTKDTSYITPLSFQPQINSVSTINALITFQSHFFPWLSTASKRNINMDNNLANRPEFE